MTTLEAAANIGIITTQAANDVLWLTDNGGIQPGSFRESLYTLIAKADPTNRMRLVRAFPTEVAAYKIAHDHNDGIEILRLIAKGDAR